MYLPDDIKDKRPAGMVDNLLSKMRDDFTWSSRTPWVWDTSLLCIEPKIWSIIAGGIWE